MKKLLSILGAVGLTATGASVAVSCSGEKPESIVLALGELNNKESTTIIAAFNAKNPNNKVSDKATVKDITDTSATIVDGTTEHKVTFTIKATVIELKLGELADKQPATIIAAFNAKNPNNKVSEEATVNDITDTSATIVDGTTEHKVTFTIKAA
ncbi:hypothetical protein CK556_02555 [Mesoplasma chauliocola]|uniref:Lipoprotein n=1 Tax=Mesoplasma chauliocola TaxID=216427 RepID=A0A249SNN3_9MOLU|nr:lipoprotein [Mesoplasma chauliocola]ASZ09222.1 hypothetical protein CK556_02555 [Mesoplasma chauliocola]